MDTENWLPAVEEVLDAATQWLRSIAPAELDQVPDWGIWVIIAIGVLVIFSVISKIVGALLRPVLKLVQSRCLLGGCRRCGPLHLALAWLCQLRTRLATIIARGDNARGHVSNRRNRLTSCVKLHRKAQG